MTGVRPLRALPRLKLSKRKHPLRRWWKYGCPKQNRKP